VPDENAEQPSRIEQEVQQVLGERSTVSDQDAKTITLLIIRIREEDEADSAENELFDLVMDDLKRRAKSALRKYPGLERALDAEDLISDSFLTLRKNLATVSLRDRSHFFAYAYNKFTWLLRTAAKKLSIAPEGKKSTVLRHYQKQEDDQLRDQLEEQERWDQIVRACQTLSGLEEQVFSLRFFGLEYLEDDKKLSDKTSKEFSKALGRDEPAFRKIAAECGLTVDKTWRTYQSALKTIEKQIGENPMKE
jgi:RNA polymerase sigma factor (sigma-70 family)